jgi:hypothetical protein
MYGAVVPRLEAGDELAVIDPVHMMCLGAAGTPAAIQ